MTFLGRQYPAGPYEVRAPHELERNGPGDVHLLGDGHRRRGASMASEIRVDRRLRMADRRCNCHPGPLRPAYDAQR